MDPFTPALMPTGSFCQLVKRGLCPWISAWYAHSIHHTWLI